MLRFLSEFRPAYRAGSVLDITPAFLAERGIAALILDLDNTLVPWHGHEVAPEIAAWIREMQEAGVRLCIVSNTHRPRRLQELAAVLGILHVPSGGKPRRRGFYRAMAAMESTVDNTAVVGDQLMTDIWGGNRAGLMTILVEQLSPVEFWPTKVINRNLERLLLDGLRRGGVEIDLIARPTVVEGARPEE